MRHGAAELFREIADAGRSLLRLGRFDPFWHEGLDISAGGFVRSFFAPVFALPFHLVFVGLFFSRGGETPVAAPMLWALGLAYLVNAFGFPLLVGLVARPFGFSAGYAPFVILTNWAGLYFNLALCAIAPLLLLGSAGLDTIGRLAWMALFALRVFITWRASRTTLSNDIAPALLMVVLLVGVDLGADQVMALVSRMATPPG